MKYYYALYQDEKANKEQKEKYLITLSNNDSNHLEIFHSVLLIQASMPQEDIFVVGVADSSKQAMEIVEKIVQEVYDNTKGTDIKCYILQKQHEYEEGNE